MLEAFAEYGRWNLPFLQYGVARRGLDRLSPNPAPWHGYCVWAADDTKVHRTSKDVWGTCTFHEYTARCPTGAGTVRAYNWVVLGRVAAQRRPAGPLPADRRPAVLPQDPAPRKAEKGPPIPLFRTKCALLVELGREHANSVLGQDVGRLRWRVALRSAGCGRWPGSSAGPAAHRLPDPALPCDARLHALPPVFPDVSGGAKGAATPKWGKRLPPPRQGGRVAGRPGSAARPSSTAAWRPVRYKEVVCLWRVLGHEVPVKAVVAQVEGYQKRFTLVSSAMGPQRVAVGRGDLLARFRQEDAFRDLKNVGGGGGVPGVELASPIERTTQAVLVTLTASCGYCSSSCKSPRGVTGGCTPRGTRRRPWPSVLDVERLMRRHREQIQRLLSKWARDEGKTVLPFLSARPVE